MGTALGKMLCDAGREVTLWTYEQELAEQIERTHENTMFLPGVELPGTLRVVNSLAEALDAARVVFSVTPSQVLRTVWTEAGKYLEPDASIVCASKGVEIGTAKLMSEVLDEVLPSVGPARLAFLSGPSFAKEIVAGHPTAVVVASRNLELARSVQTITSTSSFRAYTTDDVVGVELGGAIKNVIAIAVGVAEGLGFGHNTRAGLITRGLAEVSRLAVACGADPLTLAGLAGVGDLVLTCTGHLSRNLQVGIRLGKGTSLSEILEGMKMVAEGVKTAYSAVDLAKLHGVDMPISRVVVQILNGDMAAGEAVRSLMSRRLREEKDFCRP